MSKIVQVQEGWHRAVEKELSRHLDAHAVKEGFSSCDELAIKNDFFASLNLSNFRISAVGRQPISRSRRD